MVFIIDKLTFYLEFLLLQPDFWLVTPDIICSKSVLSIPHQGGAWIVKKGLNSIDEGRGISGEQPKQRVEMENVERQGRREWRLTLT